MQDFRYLSDSITLEYDPEKCIGCGMCEIVCPHGVFNLQEGKAVMADRGGCMECGACVKNCPTQAVNVSPGVGCASYIINSWLKSGKSAGCC